MTKSLLLYGHPKTRRLIDYIPSVPLSESEHLKTLHPVLNEHLGKKGLWQRNLSAPELERAFIEIARFYESRKIPHFAAAVREFHDKVYKLLRSSDWIVFLFVLSCLPD
ncbi:MAG: hypothetical protein V1736_07350 [Pseudomonadota bacterium]